MKAHNCMKMNIEEIEVREFNDYLLMKGFSESSASRYEKDVEHFIAWTEEEHIELEQVGYQDILHYIQGQRKKVKQKTISSKVNSLKHYFDYLILSHQQIENPTRHIDIKGIKRKKLYDILSRAELEILFNDFGIERKEKPRDRNKNWFKTSELTSKRNKVILGLMIYQGLGTTELSRLTERDIKLREGKIRISASRKSNERELRLEAHQVLDLMEYKLTVRQEILDLKSKTSERLFVSTGESDYFRNIISKLIKKLRQQNKKVKSVLQIRASVITHWLKTHNLREVQYRAGHRYVSSTEAYLVNDIEDLQEDINKFHPL